MKFKLFATVLLVALLLAGCGEAAQVNTPQPPQTQRSQDPAPAGQQAVQPTTTPTELTPQEAQDIALAHAGASAQQVYDLHVERDREWGEPCYDVEFDWNGYEYSYEIHRQTGHILHWEKDRD